jgi:manganese-dependent inorganic pyrophosphatase
MVNINEKIYVIGHLNPDTDTVVSAMSMAAFLNARERTDKYVAVTTGKANSETSFIFEKFGLKYPEIIETATDKKLFLVDHNEPSQIVNGSTSENIVGFCDHHKIKFECGKPIEIITKPWGSTNTIIYDLFKKELLDIPQELKPAMLCAILSDTVILKSPTTTPVDMMIVEQLSEELDIDFKELGMEMFKAKAQISSKTPMEILKNDFKNFDFNGKKIGVGQLETPDLKEVETKINEIKSEMNSMKQNDDYYAIILMLTDIIQEGTKLLIVSNNNDSFATMFNTNINDGLTNFIPGMMSRKKQVAPVLDSKL